MGVISLGKLHPQEVDTPPPSIAPPPLTPDRVAGVISGRHATPPTFVYTQRREPMVGPSFTMAPDDNSQRFYDLDVAWQEAPDPIRQSDFWQAGNKVNPQARMNITSHLAIGSREAVDEQTFRIGKLLGYMKRPMYQGMQAPSMIRSNIMEAQPSTYGSQYMVENLQPSPGVVTATGFQIPLSSPTDGYPY